MCLPKVFSRWTWRSVNEGFDGLLLFFLTACLNNNFCFCCVWLKRQVLSYIITSNWFSEYCSSMTVWVQSHFFWKLLIVEAWVYQQKPFKLSLIRASCWVGSAKPARSLSVHFSKRWKDLSLKILQNTEPDFEITESILSKNSQAVMDLLFTYLL